MPKGPFLYWSKESIGSNAWLKMLSEHYILLSATYLQRGMDEESKLFASVAEEFSSARQELLKQAARKSPPQ